MILVVSFIVLTLSSEDRVTVEALAKVVAENKFVYLSVDAFGMFPGKKSVIAFLLLFSLKIYSQLAFVSK